MLILTIRTDKPEAELGLFDDQTQLAYQTWQAHRQLSVTIHHKIDELLQKQAKTLPDIDGIICFQGPGSFTGLRIGLSLGNALAYGLKKPIVATGGKTWIEHGIKLLQNDKTDLLALPKYGAPANITLPKK